MKLTIRTRKARKLATRIGFFLVFELGFVMWSLLAHDIVISFLFPGVLLAGAIGFLIIYGVLEGLWRLDRWINGGQEK
jgi:hypothetical protein